MSLIAASLNDAGITLLADSEVRYREPGFALLDGDELSMGTAAWRAARLKPRQISHRFWDQLSAEPMEELRFQHLSSADLVSRQLEAAWQTCNGSQSSVMLAVPGYYDAAQLGLLLGILADLGVPVRTMVDSAVAATRRPYESAVPLHLDVSLHRMHLTRLAQNGDQVSVERAETLTDCGLLALNDAWVHAVAEAFVRDSRFDPLHTADCEQMLQDNLPDWLRAATTQGSVEMQISYRGIEHTATIGALELTSAVAPLYQRIVSGLRPLLQADEVPALQLTDQAGQLPGLAAMLKARAGGEVFTLEPAATVRGLQARANRLPAATDGVARLRQLPFDQPAVTIETGADRIQAGAPTHVLFRHTVYDIREQPLVLGSQPEAGEQRIRFDREMPGLSRRHCSIAYEGRQCIVRDFSRFGTFLNGHRIEESAALQTGDYLRLGTPGFEFQLITTETADGA